MSAFDSLSPQQRQLLMIGAPVVAVFALVAALQKRNAASTPTPTTGYTLPSMPSTDAIGTSQLSEFESLLAGSINTLTNQVGTLTAQVSSTPIAAAPPAPAAMALPHINSADYPVIALPGTDFDVLGSLGGGGSYNGQNVSGGAPVYAWVNGQWQQNFNAQNLPAGTPLATPSQFRSYEVGGSITEQL